MDKLFHLADLTFLKSTWQPWSGDITTTRFFSFYNISRELMAFVRMSTFWKFQFLLEFGKANFEVWVNNNYSSASLICRQFHQRFFAHFFGMNVLFGSFSSYVSALAPKFSTKNAHVNVDEIDTLKLQCPEKWLYSFKERKSSFQVFLR